MVTFRTDCLAEISEGEFAPCLSGTDRGALIAITPDAHGCRLFVTHPLLPESRTEFFDGPHALAFPHAITRSDAIVSAAFAMAAALAVIEDD